MTTTNETDTELWTASELASCFPGTRLERGVSGVSIDSRSVEPGDLFIALSGDPGPRFGGGNLAGALDGHDFAGQAAVAGAAAVMAHRDIDADVPVIRVDDTLDGLWRLAQAARQRMQGRCVAITGSSGKTTLRHWLETVLAGFAKTHASTGSLNNHWGVPLSMARMPGDAGFGVFEVGTNHPGEIAPLSELVNPHLSVLLNVLPAHIGNFRNVEALTREKLSIAVGLVKEGILVLPYSLKEQADHGSLVTFGFEAEADIQGSHADDWLTVRAGDQSVNCRPPFLDKGRCLSVLAVFAVCISLGLDMRTVAAAISGLGLPDGRGNTVLLNDITLIDDSYNANPVSMLMALDDLRQRQGKRRIVLLGEMLELGEMTPATHREVLQSTSGLDRVVTFGQQFSDAAREAGVAHFASTDSFDLQAFARTLQAGDVILIKGSNRVFWKNHFVSRLITVLGDGR